MVFTSLVRYGRNLKGGPRSVDRFWRKRKILRMSAHFYGRKRQCYSIAIRYVHKAWQYLTAARKIKKQAMTKVWDQRVAAACAEHGVSYDTFRRGLLRLDILLNRKVLADLAVFEPRTFKSLASLSMGIEKEDGLNSIKSLSSPPPPGVYVRNFLKEK